ncbi:helix-turn-helix domain-containing protein [Chloroflexota bacterium]
MEQEAFLNISEASRILGVSEAALRQWTDEGKIKAFITPGGHRRYSKVELKKLTSSHSRMLGVKDLVTELEETNGQLRKIGHESLKSMAWYGELSDEGKKHLADLGRRLLNMIIKYITDPSHRQETMRLVREVGHDFGETLSSINLPLTDSVETFILHRDPIMKAVTHLMKKREAFTGRIVEAIPIVTRIMDEALIALVAAHYQYRDGIYSSKGDAPD